MTWKWIHEDVLPFLVCRLEQQAKNRVQAHEEKTKELMQGLCIRTWAPTLGVQKSVHHP
jgi:hypothetical protein